MNKGKIYKDREEEKYERVIKAVIGLIFSILFLFGAASFGYIIYWIFRCYGKLIVSGVIVLGIIVFMDAICKEGEN